MGPSAVNAMWIGAGAPDVTRSTSHQARSAPRRTSPKSRAMPPLAILRATGARYGRPDGAWCVASEQPGLKVRPSVQWPVVRRPASVADDANQARTGVAASMSSSAAAARTAARRMCKRRPTGLAGEDASDAASGIAGEGEGQACR